MATFWISAVTFDLPITVAVPRETVNREHIDPIPAIPGSKGPLRPITLLAYIRGQEKLQPHND
jgi:hypothetical protein